MTAKKFSNALGGIGEKYINEAVTYTAKKKMSPWVKWGVIAACLCLVVTGGVRGAIALDAFNDSHSELGDQSSKEDDKNNDNSMSDYTIVSYSADYPLYKNYYDIANAATNIYIGTVESITYEIIDMKTGKVDDSPKSQSSSRMLYTVYTISVKSSLKGENPSEIKICRIGGLVGYNEKQQYDKMLKSGLLNRYNGIPVVAVDEGVILDIGSEYLFCTKRSSSEFDFVINPTQFAHKTNSEEAELIVKSIQ